MDIYQIKSFVTVAREKNLTRSAEILCITQPALSTQIKQLEEELGMSLFKRTPRGMELTEDGSRLFQEAVILVEKFESFKNSALKMKNTLSGKVLLGVNTNIDTLKIDKLNSALSSDYPDIEIHLIQSSSLEIRDMIKKGKVDLGFFFGENTDDSVNQFFLGRMNLSLAFPSRWKINSQELNPKDLENRSWIMYTDNCPFYKILKKFLDSENIKPGKMIYTNQDQVMCDLVYHEQGVSFLLEPDALRMKERGQIDIISSDKFKIDLSLIYLEERLNNPAVGIIYEKIKSIWITGK